MRAVLLHTFAAPDALRIDDVESPAAPGPGQVVVRVAAAGVNFPDLLVIDGTYQSLPELPFSPGKELSGTVESVGPGVRSLQPGDRVLAQVEYGAFRECVVVAADVCVPVPAAMPDEQAACFGLVHLTAYMALVRRAQLVRGQTVLVTGVGGAVGSATVQVAKVLGADVVAAVRDERRRDTAVDLGADHVVLADPATLREQVAEVTDGRGADVVVETVGGDVFDACLRCVAWEGRLVVTGFAQGRVPTVRAGYLLVKNIGLLGLQVSDYRDRDPADMRAALTWLLDAYAEGRLLPPPINPYPMDQVAAAVQRVRDGGLDGRVVLRVQEAAGKRRTV